LKILLEIHVDRCQIGKKVASKNASLIHKKAQKKPHKAALIRFNII